MKHREMYEDTGLEFLPHIELGRPIDLDTEQGQELRANVSFDHLVSEIDQNEHGYLARFSDADRDNLAAVIPAEEHRDAAGAVAWVRRFGSIDNDEDITIHVLDEAEIATIEESSTSLLLDALLDAREREAAGADTGRSSAAVVDKLVAHLRKRR